MSGANHLISENASGGMAGGGIAPSVPMPRDAVHRDLRLDWLRGVAICVVVIDHIDLRSAFKYVFNEQIGIVSAAELFVLVSGLVLGIVHNRRIARGGWRSSALHLVRRAGVLYLTSIAVAASVYLLRLIPGLDVSVLTTLSDLRTGQVELVYPVHPSSARAVAGLLLLRDGPWQFNIIGLYVLLLLLAPPALWLLKSRQAIPLLLISCAIYIFQGRCPVAILPCEFDRYFPLLRWQFLFIAALAAGYHREKIDAFFETAAGRRVLYGCFAAAGACVVFALNRPSQELTFLNRAKMPPTLWNAIHDGFFREKRDLGIGRLINAVVLFISVFAVLTRFRRVADKWAGSFFPTLGQATLYVFVLHVYAMLAVAQFRLDLHGTMMINTGVKIAVVAVIWWMVRNRVLFGVIPR